MSEKNTAPAPLTYPDPPEHVRRRSFAGTLKLFGPGAIIASVTIGSGETLFASRTGAIFGYGLLWFIVLCTVCKLTQVYTAGRYMVLTGEHPMEAWARLPGPRGWFPAFLGILSIFCFPFWLGGLAKMLGTAVNWSFGLDQASVEQQNQYALVIGTATLLLAGVLTVIQTYRVFEKVQTAIVGILLLAILAALAVAPIDWMAAIRSALTIRMPEYTDWMRAEHADVIHKESVLLAMVVFMGAIGGGTYDYIGYLSFFREKRWAALGIDRKSSCTAQPNIQADESNIAAGRQWLRAPVIDVFTGFLCVLIFTVAFNLLGAAILHTKHLVPKDFQLLTPQVLFLTRFGEGFKYLYQIGILMAFWGTIYGAMEVYSRTAYECARPLFAQVRTISYQRFRLPVCLYAGIGGVLLMWFVERPLDIVKPAALIGTTTCGIWCFAMIWADRKVLPKELRMNTIWLIGNILAGIIMTSFGAAAIWGQIMKDARVKTAKIERGELSVLFQDNSESPKPKLSGVQSLFNVKHAPDYDAYDPNSPGSSAGLNFEHIISGHDGKHNAFTPRHGRYDLFEMDDGKSVTLVRKADDSPWKVASTMRYTVTEPYYIDLEFKCTPQDAKLFGTRNQAIFFWADYMNQVKDVALHFRGIEKPGGKETWIRAEALKGEHPHWRGGGTYRHIDAPPIEYDSDLKFNLNSWSYDWPRFTKPFYYGLAENDMVFIVMFDRTYSPVDQVRFSLFKFKCRDDIRKPAWDFQYVINKVESGKPYGYRTRVAWKKFVSPEDCLREYETWAAQLPTTAPTK